MNTLELAQKEDIEICMEIINDGKAFQREQGFIQWTEEYPNADTLRSDVANGKGYVLKVDCRIAGYMCIDFDGEPAYADIQGKWRTKEPYAVIHRLAFGKAFRGMGLTSAAFQLIETLCCQNHVQGIRIDTDFPNTRMQHILEKHGFKNCGVIVFQGSKKLAYDKTL